MENIKTVAVIGLGYIGLPTAAILASKGIDVVGVDVKQSTVDAVNRGEVPFVEPDLGTYLAGAVSQGYLTASMKTPHADAYIIAVPTPLDGDHAADLSYIEAAADAIAPQLFGGELLVLESTSPPGATQHMADRILTLRPDLRNNEERGELFFAHCPERVLPGQVMIELVTNDRIIGGITSGAAQRAKTLYETFCHGEIHLTDAKTAEMSKLVENAFRDVNIAFANEVAAISTKLDLDVWKLIRLANRHPRVNILAPGPGVGGHCIAVDPWFIAHAAPDESRLIRAAREVNDGRPAILARQIIEAATSSSADEIAILGLAYKENIGDLRESPALAISQIVARALTGTSIVVIDPHVSTMPAKLTQYEHVRFSQFVDEARAASLIVHLVDHAEFGGFENAVRPGARIIDAHRSHQ